MAYIGTFPGYVFQLDLLLDLELQWRFHVLIVTFGFYSIWNFTGSTVLL